MSEKDVSVRIQFTVYKSSPHYERLGQFDVTMEGTVYSVYNAIEDASKALGNGAMGILGELYRAELDTEFKVTAPAAPSDSFKPEESEYANR